MKSKPYFIILLVLLLIALACITYLSTFTRFHADDFCIAADFNHLDPVSFFVNWFSGWTGRFSYIVFAGFLSLGGPELASWLPTICVLIWLVALSWAVLPLTKRFEIPDPFLFSSTAAALILVILFSVTPNLFQSVFWKDGLINYSFPLIGFTIVMGLLTRVWVGKINDIKIIFLITGLSFITGGFSEVFSTMQVLSYLILVGIGVIFTKPKNRKYRLEASIAAFIGAAIALLVVLSAPGNQVRQNLLTEHPGIIRLISFSTRNGIYIIAKFFIQKPGWAFLTVFISFVSGWIAASKIEANHFEKRFLVLWKLAWFRGLLVVPVVTLIMVITACAPVVYMLDAYPDDRTIILPLFFIVIGMMSFSGLLGFGLQRIGFLPDLSIKVNLKRILKNAIILLIFIAAAITVQKTINNADSYQTYAISWDKRDQELQLEAISGKQEVTVFGLESRYGLADLRIESDYWVNKCMADYYNIPDLFGK